MALLPSILAAVDIQPNGDTSTEWVWTVLKAAGMMVVGALGSYFAMRRKIRLMREGHDQKLAVMRADEERKQREREGKLQNTITAKDAELEALKKERRIRNTKQAERIEHFVQLTKLAIQHKEHGITLEQLDEYGDFVLKGKKVRKAEPAEAEKSEKQDVQIIVANNGDRRRVWTDKATGQQLWEYVMRPEEEVIQKRDLLRSFHHWSRTGFLYRKVQEKKEKGQPVTPEDEMAAMTFFHSDVVEALKVFPELKTEYELDIVAAKFEALAWVTGWEIGQAGGVGWPEGYKRTEERKQDKTE